MPSNASRRAGLAQIAEIDQARAAYRDVAAECDAMLARTRVGGPWDEINAKLIAVRDRAESASGRMLALQDLLPQLD